MIWRRSSQYYNACKHCGIDLPFSEFCSSLSHIRNDNKMRTLLVLFVRGYQVSFGQLLPPACRYYPSCSAYAIEALECHGAWRGGWLALFRIARCHPFRTGGYDPVP